MPYRQLALIGCLVCSALSCAPRVFAEVYEINFNEGCSLDRETEITRENAYCLETDLPLSNLENKKQNLDTLENVEEIDDEAWELQLLYENCIDGLEDDCRKLQVEQRQRLDRQPAANSVTTEEPFSLDLDY